MNFCHQLTRRFSALNRGTVGSFEAVHVQNDGHGTYMLTANHHKRHITQQVFVNPVEAKSLSSGKNNPNLDKHLRL